MLPFKCVVRKDFGSAIETGESMPGTIEQPEHPETIFVKRKISRCLTNWDMKPDVSGFRIKLMHSIRIGYPDSAASILCRRPNLVDVEAFGIAWIMPVDANVRCTWVKTI